SSPQAALYRLASLDNNGIAGAVTRNPLLQSPPRYQASDFPKVDRTLKGDRLVKTPPPEAAAPADAVPAPEDPSTSNASVAGAKPTALIPSAAQLPLAPDLQAALSAPPLAQYDAALSLEAKPLDDKPLELKAVPGAASIPLEQSPSRDGFSVKTAS